MENYEPGWPLTYDDVGSICYQTAACMCAGTTTLTEGCAGWCPGSGNCGGGGYGTQTNSENSDAYPCGVRGEKCTTLLSVPELVLAPLPKSESNHNQCMDIDGTPDDCATDPNCTVS